MYFQANTKEIVAEIATRIFQTYEQHSMFKGVILSYYLSAWAVHSLDVTQFKSESLLIEALEKSPVSSIPPSQIEEMVKLQYFDAVAKVIMRAHENQADVSVPVRNAVAETRSKLDHLVKLLDPEYSRPQRVSPAFQWTQNDTTVFINLKYSRRFNAPGAVDVSDFNCTFTDTSFIFSAIGGHSGKRFEYALNLDFFDLIDPEHSRWSTGSVGKVTLSIAKQRVSRWPRLLAGNTKIDNMHYWLDYGEQLEGSLKGLPEVSNSGPSCKAKNGKAYCPTSDSCKETCKECKGKRTFDESTNMCLGPPVYGAKDMTFTDLDPEKGSIGGIVEITLKKDHHRLDIRGFNLYVVSNGTTIQEGMNPWSISVGEVVNNTKIEFPKKPFDFSDILELVLVPFNDYGESRSRAIRKLAKDLFLPNACSSIAPVDFEDTDGDSGSLKGLFTFTSVSDSDTATHLWFHWGRDNSTKLFRSKAPFGEVPITNSSLNLTAATAIPAGASHVLIFAKSEAGETETPVGIWEIRDRERPKGAVAGLIVGTDLTVEFKKADNESDLTGYVVKAEWENRSSNTTETAEIEKLSTSSMWSFSSTIKSSVPAKTPKDSQNPRVCVYATNQVGVAKHGSCVPLPSDQKDEL